MRIRGASLPAQSTSNLPAGSLQPVVDRHPGRVSQLLQTHPDWPQAALTRTGCSKVIVAGSSTWPSPSTSVNGPFSCSTCPLRRSRISKALGFPSRNGRPRFDDAIAGTVPPLAALNRGHCIAAHARCSRLITACCSLSEPFVELLQPQLRKGLRWQ